MMATQEAEDTAGAGGSTSGGMKSPLTSNGGAVASSQYCLKWNNHKLNISNVFERLMSSARFCDLTLTSADQKFIKCHRLLLCAGSG